MAFIMVLMPGFIVIILYFFVYMMLSPIIIKAGESKHND
jgi:hypothetical protein